MSLVDRLVSDSNIEEALLYLKGKKDTCGIDGLRVSQLDNYLSNNKALLIDLLKNNMYKTQEVELVDILNKSGKVRSIAKIASVDKLVSKMLLQIIEPTLLSDLYSNSFAYQENKGTSLAATKMKEYLEQGYLYVLNVDIKKYFDNINHTILYQRLAKYFNDDLFLNLLLKFIKVNIKKEYKRYVLNKGVLQGSVLSPLLSNIYLSEIDKFFLDSNIKYIRFADDIRIFAKTNSEIIKYKECIISKLKDLDLQINEKKTKFVNANDETPIFLGYQFIKIKSNNLFELKKIIRNGNFHNYPLWNKSPLCVINDEYHIISDGILNQEDYNLLFENDNKKELLVLDHIDCINIYSNVIFSKKIFEIFYNKKIPVSIYNKYDEYLGSFVPYSINGNTKLSIEQLKCYINNDTRMYIAKQFVMSAGHNLNENLKYYYKHNQNEHIKLVINKISNLIHKENECNNYNNLLSLEGNIRILYYSCINDIINSDSFDFKNRNKRPPLDPINALFSYGNTILYRYVAKKIYKSKLDIRIGFLHATNSRLESLNLDIAEIFRPIIVDKVIFSLINRHEIKEEVHFEYKSNNACYLNEKGRKIFIQAFENKMFSKLKINNKYYSYSELIMNEIYNLCNHFMNIKKYKAYKYFM